MCHSQAARRIRLLLKVASGAILAAVSISPPSQAGVVLTSGSGSVTYSVRPLSPPPSSNEQIPTFRASDGSLIYPGNDGFPQLGDESGLIQSVGLSTSRLAGNRAIPSQIGAPGEFGEGFTEIVSTTRGSGQGAAAQKVGNFYNSTTFVQSSALTGVASVSVTQMTSTFTNTAGSSPIDIIPGLVLNVTGTLGDLNGSFVAASLTGTISIGVLGEGPFGHGEIQPAEFEEFILPPVVIAFNGQDAVNDSNTSNGFLFSGASFSSVGSSLFSTSFTIGGGVSFIIRSTLTLASDPNSIIQIGSSIPSIFPNVILPDVGGFVGAGDGIPGALAAVPEPTALLQAVSALGALGLVVRFRGARRQG